MNPKLTRRSFCQSALLGSAALPALLSLTENRAGAVDAFKRSATPRLRLGLAAYSFRDFFSTGRKKSAKAEEAAKSGPAVDMFSFIDYCAEQRCEGAELTSYYFPPDATDAYYLDVRRHAHLRGVTLTGSAVGNNFTHPAGPKREQEIASVKAWIDHAALMGMPHIRVFAGEKPKNLSLEEARANCISALEETGDYAGKKGVFLGIENHGGIVPDGEALMKVVRAVKNPWVGINLDTGNFHTADPFVDLELCAPYSVNVQYKADMRAAGQTSKPSDLPRVLNVLRKAKYQGFVTLEYESPESPWTAVPRILEQLRTELAKG